MRSIRAPPRARRRRRRRRRRSRAPPRRPAPRRRRRPSRPPRRWAPRAGSRPAPPARRSSSRETVCCGERSEGGSGGQRRARASVARGRRVDCLSARQNVRADRGFPRAAPGVFEGVRGRGNARLGLDAIDRGRSPRDRATIAPGQPRTRPARRCLRLLSNRRKTKIRSGAKISARTAHRRRSREGSRGRFSFVRRCYPRSAREPTTFRGSRASAVPRSAKPPRLFWF